MNLERIEALLEVFHGVRVHELVVEGDGWRVGARKAAPLHSPPPAPSAAPAPPAAAPALDAPTPPRAVNATLVGIFRAADPAVRVGDRVQVGQPAGSIDSMGIPNPVLISAAGRVSAVAVADGEGVQYGQLLFQVVEDAADAPAGDA